MEQNTAKISALTIKWLRHPQDREQNESTCIEFTVIFTWIDRKQWVVPPNKDVMASIRYLHHRDNFAYNFYGNSVEATLRCTLEFLVAPDQKKLRKLIKAIASQIELRDPVPYRLLDDASNPDGASMAYLQFYNEAQEEITLLVPFDCIARLPAATEGTFLTKRQITRLMQYQVP